jgi:hypothetical protein
MQLGWKEHAKLAKVTIHEIHQGGAASTVQFFFKMFSSSPALHKSYV